MDGSMKRSIIDLFMCEHFDGTSINEEIIKHFYDDDNYDDRVPFRRSTAVLEMDNSSVTFCVIIPLG